METERSPKSIPKEATISKSRASSNDSHSLSVAKSESQKDSGEENEAIELGCKAQDATFPQQLMDVIERETTNGSTTSTGEKVLEWLPNGDAFIIRDKALLEREVLPRHFSAKCKFMSFVRKLYRWGFRQVEKNVPGVTIFMHTNFIRGDKNRCLLMRSIVKNSANASSAQSSAPLQGGNLVSGATVNPNFLEGLSRNFMGIPGHFSQLSKLHFHPVPGGTIHVPNLLSIDQQHQLYQQQTVNNITGLLSNGSSPNSFSLSGTSLPALSMNASNSIVTGAPQQLRVRGLLHNINELNVNSIGGATLPSAMTTSGVIESRQVDIKDLASLGQVSNSAPNSSNSLCLGTTLSSSTASATAFNPNSRNLGDDNSSPIVMLAMQIMQNNPTIDPRVALELARRIRGEV
eukprot:CCRYP_011046-RA/>CCRYP_011046-RA protein AED:0.00 eAED:0.00 QI:393/1/1/1/1/1/2/147/403